MALIKCPECDGTVSDKAISCPHCGYPLNAVQTPRRKKRASAIKRRRNGSGSVVRLSGNRSHPFEVRVNCRLDQRGYPKYDVLDRFQDKIEAESALAEYNKNPYDIETDKMTFAEVYKKFYEKKYFGTKKYSKSSEWCTQAAYKHCKSIHDAVFKKITADQLQDVLDDDSLSHATLEHMKSLFTQMWKYGEQYDIIQKDVSRFVTINKPDDDKIGIPFTKNDITALWNHLEIPYVDTILIFIYSGWRINELLNMPAEHINLKKAYFFGGSKTESGKNRYVPIHTKIMPLDRNRMKNNAPYLVMNGSRKMNAPDYRNIFYKTLRTLKIKRHTPHDCRHTFASLLDSAGANEMAIKLMLGHKIKNDITKERYIHKNLEELRKNIELI